MKLSLKFLVAGAGGIMLMNLAPFVNGINIYCLIPGVLGLGSMGVALALQSKGK